MDIKDETEETAVIVINQRAYTLPKDVVDEIKELRKQNEDCRRACMDLQDVASRYTARR